MRQVYADAYGARVCAAQNDTFGRRWPSGCCGSQFIQRLSFGSLRACVASKQYRVEIDSIKQIIVPGGRSEPLPSTYFRVIETGDGYQLLAAGTKPDPSCAGPDLMKKN